MPKHGLGAAVVLRVIDMEAEVFVNPASEGARSLADVLLGVVADAHGEELHEFAAEIFVGVILQVHLVPASR